MDKLVSVIILISVVSIQYCGAALLSYYSMGVLKEQYSIPIMMTVIELIKMILTLLCMSVLEKKQGIVESAISIAMDSMKHIPQHILSVVEDYLFFYCLRNIDVNVYSALVQSYIISNTLLNHFKYNKEVTITQWRALVALLLSIFIVEESMRPSNAGYLYFVSVITAAGCSMGTGAYSLLVANGETVEEDNIFVSSFQSSLYGICISIILSVFGDFSKVFTFRFFEGFSIYTVGIVVLSTIGYVIALYCKKKFDNNMKNISIAASLVLVLIMSYVCQLEELNLELILGIIAVNISIVNFNDYKAQPEFQNAEGLDAKPQQQQEAPKETKNGETVEIKIEDNSNKNGETITLEDEPNSTTSLLAGQEKSNIEIINEEPDMKNESVVIEDSE